MFIDRETELEALDTLLRRPAAQFAVLYGRRRVGKTTLILEWARRSGLPFVYWVAARESSALLLRSFSQAIYNHAHPDTGNGITRPADPLFTYPTWEMAFREAAALGQDRQTILVMDEFPYAAQSESALPSLLQNAWDHAFKPTQTALVLAGSQVGMMIDLLGYHAPLYGRMTAQLDLKPLPFRALAQFYPRYSTAERVAVYAILGGIPAYLEKFDDRLSLSQNVREQIFSISSIFQNEALFLLQDEVREVSNYLAVIRAIGEGAHTLDAIAKSCGLAKNHVSTYLARLQDLAFVRREVPVTVPPGKRTTQGRYVLSDAYLRFYFRFVAPNQVLVEQGLLNRLWRLISEEMRAFVGMTAFEEICRTWTLQQAASAGQPGSALPFIPDAVGRHWSPDCEIDVAAINWRARQVLLGECKWGVHPVGRDVIRDLIEERGPRVLERLEGDWQAHYVFFARAGFTDAAREDAARLGATLVDLARLDRDLQSAHSAAIDRTP
jgi:AAA+ ATPase superfamily predicted ATPase